MGQLFKCFKRFNYTTSTYLNSSKNCCNDSTMTGMKIAIIFFAIAMISFTANAAPFNLDECEKCVEECVKIKMDACTGGLLEQILCGFANTVECRNNKCREQGVCEN